MTDRIELSPSGRSKCRACQQTIEKGALRLGVMVPNPFGEGEATHFYHLECGAWRQPDAYLAAVGVTVEAESGTGDVEAPEASDAPDVETAALAAAKAEATRAASEAALGALDAERRAALRAQAELSRQHHRLRRFVKVERAKTARAHCRHCRETIDKGALRLGLEIIEDGRAAPAGFLHLTCARPYAGPVESVLLHLARSEEVTDEDFSVVRAALEGPG